MNRFLLAILLVTAFNWIAAAQAGDVPSTLSTGCPPNRNVTFLSTSDSHFRTTERPGNNDWDHETIEEMNKVASLQWPEQLGGDSVENPRGVVCLGDCIDDGDMKKGSKNWSEEQYGFWLKEFGFDGTDGHVKFPVYEGWGNHDGPPIGKERFFSFQAHLKQRNELRLQRGMISNVSANGLHYSWDWDDVHFVELNLYPADKQNPKVHYSAVWHDPQGSLSFMKQDLAGCVGRHPLAGRGRPVVLLAHCGFDTDWWVPEDWKNSYEAAKDYNVVLYDYGHTGTGLHEWAPPGETRKWTCINDGQTTAGFFVIQIKGDRLRAAYRTRENVKYDKKPGHDIRRTDWDGAWGWKWLLDKSLARPR